MRPPLARAFRAAGLDTIDVAAHLQVDPKTVQRWLAGRVPYPRHREALARLTGWRLDDLWPSAAPAHPKPQPPEIQVIYPHRSAVPAEVWRHHFARAVYDIGILVYSGLFLAEDPEIPRLFLEKARSGVRVRLALGDPAGQQVARRGDDEGIGDLMASRIHNALHLYRPILAAPGVQVRLHDTALYNSIYRSDDALLVNAHLQGSPAAIAPVLHLHRSQGDGLATTYLASFEQVWNDARPL